MAKLKRIVDYKNLTPALLELLAAKYPNGYSENDVIKFKNAQNESVSAIPLETEESYFLIKIKVVKVAGEDVTDADEPAYEPDREFGTGSKEEDDLIKESDSQDDDNGGYDYKDDDDYNDLENVADNSGDDD